MNGKRNTGKKSHLVGLKWLLTALSVAGTLGLWQVFAEAKGSTLNTSGAPLSQAADQNLASTGTGSRSGAGDNSPGSAFKIIIDGSRAPRPLAVTRSS